MTMLYLVCYDIANPRRLAQVARVMEGFGERVQESVFECRLTRHNRTRLAVSLEALRLKTGSDSRTALSPACAKASA